MSYRWQLTALAAAALVAAAACSGAHEASAPATAAVMSFNLRLDTPADSAHCWAARRDAVADMLAYYRPDLLGMQEVLHNQLMDLRQALPGYVAVGVARDDGRQSGEYCPIFVNSSRFAMLDHGDFSLSEHPDSFGVKGWDAAYNRVATWALLADKASGAKLACLNTHLDDTGPTARREGLRLILRRLGALAPGLPAIITGDFNVLPGDELADTLRSAGMNNAAQVAGTAYGPQWSYHDFGRLPVGQRQLLDYIYVSPSIAVDRYRSIQDVPAEGYLSDHNPIMADLTIAQP